MTIGNVWAWLVMRPKRWSHLQQVPMRRLWSLIVAVFLLFCVIGFYLDVMSGGTLPYALVILYAVLSGLNALTWLVVLSRLPRIYIGILIVAEFFNGAFNARLADLLRYFVDMPAVEPSTGLHFAGTAILILVITSYSFFTRYMGMTGKESIRIQNELDLAHSIQKTLVPPISRTTGHFEIYGISEPSEKVGGDLVDLVELPNGDTVAYLADIAGHGLQAGILMGMLKTAARTALADEEEGGGEILSLLMHRLNVVLPQVKEAHMYATFTGLRLSADGQVFYGMAASPPLLHWNAAAKTMTRLEEQQFPLGLLPVAHFPAGSLAMASGDMLVIATDGILEVTSQLKSQKEVEYGADRLEALIAEHAGHPWQSHPTLPELARMILDAVRSYGKQVDDQTLLLVRRLA